MTAEEYKKKYYKPGEYHWETSGRHAYSAILKSEGKNYETPTGERKEGLSREKCKCHACKKVIQKHSRIVKIGEFPFHVGCEP